MNIRAKTSAEDQTSSMALPLVPATILLILCGVSFVWVAWEHVLYPGFLEAMEGDVLQHISRIAEGLSPYPGPNEEFIPLAHMPLYYFAAAPFYKLFGDSFVGPRLLSSLCAIGSGVLVGLISFFETKSKNAGIMGSALFFAGYRIMDECLTCALPDSMMLFLLISGYLFFAYGKNWLHEICWLVLFSLAFWSKQHAAFYFGLFVFYAVFLRKNHLPKWGIVGAMLLGGPVTYLIIGQYLGDGFFYHTFLVPGRWERAVWFSASRMGFILTTFIPFSTLLFIIYIRRTLTVSSLFVPPLAWFAIASLLSSTVTMMSSGSSNNHYLPLIAALTAIAPITVARPFNQKECWLTEMFLVGIAVAATIVVTVSVKLFPGHPIPRFVPWVTTGVLIVWLVLRRLNRTGQYLSLVVIDAQFAVCFYLPQAYAPLSSFNVGLTQLRGELSTLDAPVIWVSYGNVPMEMTGIKMAPAPSGVALEDVKRQRGSETGAQAALKPFRDRILSKSKLYTLSEKRLDDYFVWKEAADRFRLVKDYGSAFSSVRLLARHWYGDYNYPRYLYVREGTTSDSSSGEHTSWK